MITKAILKQSKFVRLHLTIESRLTVHKILRNILHLFMYIFENKSSHLNTSLLLTNCKLYFRQIEKRLLKGLHIKVQQ